MDNTELIRKAQNAYYREYRKKNPEKIKKYIERYWLKKAAQMNADELDCKIVLYMGLF